LVATIATDKTSSARILNRDIDDLTAYWQVFFGVPRELFADAGRRKKLRFLTVLLRVPQIV
jgi:hypothetical protein